MTLEMPGYSQYLPGRQVKFAANLPRWSIASIFCKGYQINNLMKAIAREWTFGC
jgi:hypothetical protein